MHVAWYARHDTANNTACAACCKHGNVSIVQIDRRQMLQTKLWPSTAKATRGQLHTDGTSSLQDAFSTSLISKLRAIATLLLEAQVQFLRQAMSGVNSNSFAAGCSNTHALVSVAAMDFTYHAVLQGVTRCTHLLWSEVERCRAIVCKDSGCACPVL